MSVGVISMGIRCPIIREGDDLQRIVIDSILRTTELEDGDVIGITESVVARSQGNYVTVDEIARETVRLFGKDAEIVLEKPIYSRNRFSMILKGIARAAKKVILVMPEYDEVGNPCGVNPWTGVDIVQYYKEICESENCDCEINDGHLMDYVSLQKYKNRLYCGLHDYNFWTDLREHTNDNNHTLVDYFPDRCEWGLLGSNKANEETLKLFPDKAKAQNLVDSIQSWIKEHCGINVVVCIYGDGCFHSPGISGIPGTSINEFADPQPLVAYTNPELIESCPNEGKLKYYADCYPEYTLEQILEKIKQDKGISTKGKEVGEGCTPRRRDALIATLMDLTSGSGDRAIPIVLVKNYFNA